MVSVTAVLATLGACFWSICRCSGPVCVLCSGVIEHRPKWCKEDLHFPDASLEERAAAVGRKAAYSSKFEGVRQHTRSGVWHAYILTGGKQMHLGSYENETDAALARDRHAPANRTS